MVFIGIKSKQYMRKIFKLIILLIILSLVGCNKIYFDAKQLSEQKQVNFINRKLGTPLGRSALNRLARNITIEIVREGYLTGGDKYIPIGSGVIIAKEDLIYYVLTAEHISNNDNGLLAFIRSEKPGKAVEVLPLKFIKRDPQKDLAVLAFTSFTNYTVIELDVTSQLDNENQIYIVGWPGSYDREGLQFTPAKVTNPKIGNNLTYQPTEPGENLYKGMSGGAILNKKGKLVGIHVGVTQLDGDGKGVLISTFLSDMPQEIKTLLTKTNFLKKEENLTSIVPDDITLLPKSSFNFWWLIYIVLISIVGGLGYLIYPRLRHFQILQLFKLTNKFQNHTIQKAARKSTTTQKIYKERNLNDPIESASFQLAKTALYTEESEKGESFNFEVVKVNDVGKIVNRNQGNARQKIEDLGNGIKLEMVYIPGGTFVMGSPNTEAKRRDNEGPQHKVTLKPFYMSKYPITQEQYQVIMGDNPSHFKGKNLPVEKVSWYDATNFCQKLSKKIGGKYSLPSEGQWEYACRAGTTTSFYFGETITPKLVNYCGNYTYGNGPKGEYRGETTPVGKFPPNAFGLYDMHGNVFEWCADDFHENYNGAPTDGSVWLNGDKKKGRLRGGSWAYIPVDCRSAYRDYFNRRDAHYVIIGFRLVCDGGRPL
jgi:formylglycine-generating enzyme required for sulfatase activity